ncbi:hypothetical protein O181_108708 [Austropuccinia psidii MF-1]|uniref:Uncharacterized protein n=1 Tax=Austropuccinia psidii MF-1 TaxID=1389203 RepID=A0A9Q3JUQ5_9BASI|nr:hypothetical protein [Austropuccinia psidii MF-1]
MSPVHLRNQPEDRECLSRTRRPGRGHLGDSGGWQDTEGNNTHSAIHFPIQQEPQTRGLEGHGSSPSAPPTPQRFISMEHGKHKLQPGIPEEGQISSLVASNHSETNRSVAKSHHSSQYQKLSRRRQGYKGKNKTTLSQRKRESDPIIQKLLGLVKEEHKNQK